MYGRALKHGLEMRLGRLLVAVLRPGSERCAPSPARPLLAPVSGPARPGPASRPALGPPARQPARPGWRRAAPLGPAPCMGHLAVGSQTAPGAAPPRGSRAAQDGPGLGLGSVTAPGTGHQTSASEGCTPRQCSPPPHTGRVGAWMHR